MVRVVKALLLMGGEGRRFGSGMPKQFHRLGGKPLYWHTLQNVASAYTWSELLLVCHRDWIEEVKREVAALPVRVVAGGGTRQESSFLGLQACGEGTETVLIHDAVRPFVSRALLREHVALAEQKRAINTCIPSTDTLVFSPDGQHVAAIPDRAAYLRGQTPQTFAYDLIMEAHRRAAGGQASDDCGLVLALGEPIHIVRGEETNIKITTSEDLLLAELLLRTCSESSGEGRLSLVGKRVAVTGGSGGIGSAIVALLEEEGAEVHIVARRSSAFPCDLTEQQEARRVFAELGALDALINCIGALKVQPFASLSDQEIDQLVRVNLLAPIYSCRYADLRGGGHLLNIASSIYARGRRDFALYAACKAALVNFTQSLAEERPDLRVNALAPCRTSTAMRSHCFPDESPEELLDPLEVARTAVDLLKNGALTGAIVPIRKR